MNVFKTHFNVCPALLSLVLQFLEANKLSSRKRFLFFLFRCEKIVDAISVLEICQFLPVLWERNS